MRIPLEVYLVGEKVHNDLIFSAIYVENKHCYKLRIRCGTCNHVVEKYLSDKILAFRCNKCNKRWYIVGRKSSKSDDIVGYKIISKEKYSSLRNQFKLSGKGVKFVDYIQDIYSEI